MYIENIKTAMHYQDASLREAAIDVKNPRKQQEALFRAAMNAIHSKYTPLSTGMDIAKLIHDKDLQQQAMHAIWEKGCQDVDIRTIVEILEAYNFLSPELKNPALRMKLLKEYFSKCKEFNEGNYPMDGYIPCNNLVYKDVFMLTFNSANEEDKLTILLAIAKIVKNSSNYYDREPSDTTLLEEIRNCASLQLQKDFMYALLKQTLKSLSYTGVLECFIPAASVCDEDIDGLIQNVLSKEQPSFTEDWITSEYEPIMIVDPSYGDPFYHDYADDGNTSIHDMCQAVLNLYMPCQQISVEKKNLMLEVIASNKSFKKDFRLRIIKDYVQDDAFAQYLLLIVEHGQAQRFMRTKSAAKVDPS